MSKISVYIIFTFLYLAQSSLFCVQKSEGYYCSYGNKVYCFNGGVVNTTSCTDGCYFGSCDRPEYNLSWYTITLIVTIPIVLIFVLVLILILCKFTNKKDT